MNLSQLQKACEAFGIKNRFMDGRIMFFEEAGAVKGFWDGKEEDGRVAFLFRDAIQRWVLAFYAHGCVYETDKEAERAESVWMIAADFLEKPTGGFTTVGAAECLVTMYEAMEGR